MVDSLPLEQLRRRFDHAIAHHPVVITAPTGSGKSTQVPQWCPGKVLVLEPRRVACKTLAARVAQLMGCELGTEVGFHVRDHRVATDGSRILFATPGIVLRLFGRIDRFDTVIVDEFHERTLEIDLILALLRARYHGQLVVMSATMQAERVTAYLTGIHLHAEGRVFPVQVHYVPGNTLLPDTRELTGRTVAACELARQVPGDVLVFLPGKAEIAATKDALRQLPDCELLPLHGGLTLEQQTQVFRPYPRRKIILATNVAETSVTVPGIGVVIDSGLVRRTRYHRGRGFLTLMPIAADSAEQRTGRAGRTGPGVCYRLWSEAARLEATSVPEIRREALLPLVLAAANCDAQVQQLEFLDPPKDYAVTAAQDDGRALGALDEDDHITSLGREVFGLPLDAPLGRLLVEAGKRDILEDAIDLVAVLAVGRPIVRARRGPPNESDELFVAACDASLFITALRRANPREHPVNRFTWQEAREHARRLRRAFGLKSKIDPLRPVDREGLARTALAADPRSAYVARQRRGRTSWSNGGTEIELARQSVVNATEKVKALVVFETRALGKGWRNTRIVATCATPVPRKWLVQAGLGRDRVARVRLKQGRMVARIERVFARKVLEQRDEVPQGALAREAAAELMLQGTLFAEAMITTRQRLRAAQLASRLAASGRLDQNIDHASEPAGLDVRQWLLERLETLGVQSADDLELLSAADVLAPELSYELNAVLEKEFPQQLSAGDARYDVEYDLAEGLVTLRWQQGKRGSPPSLASLPRFPGFRIRVDTGRGSCMLREHG